MDTFHGIASNLAMKSVKIFLGVISHCIPWKAAGPPETTHSSTLSGASDPKMKANQSAGFRSWQISFVDSHLIVLFLPGDPSLSPDDVFITCTPPNLTTAHIARQQSRIHTGSQHASQVNRLNSAAICALCTTTRLDPSGFAAVHSVNHSLAVLLLESDSHFPAAYLTWSRNRGCTSL